ncbi:hypothetical protein [Paenibacillus dakarensis]|uniref:hypothetical protein n=1 Tax=Paenibacillus dakarensis TaxID=1527293 RepID=UPI0006D54B78|nr:hypothetical protein [Paenibacillus dakarensis]
MKNDQKIYYVSVTHNLIQDVPNDSNEFVVCMNDEQLTKLRDLMNEVSQSDKYAFKRTFVPYKSADHDDAAEEFDERTIELYAYLYQYGDEKTRELIKDMNLIPKMDDTGYDHPGYEESPFNK